MTSESGLPSTTSEKPGFFYGYVIVITACIIITLTFGINYTFGVFFEPLIAEFGWTRAVTSAAYSFLTLAAGLWGILAGRISDKPGPKIVSIIGGFCLGLGFLLMSRVTALWQVYLVYGLIISAGIGVCWPILLPAVAKWFVARRGLMTGIASAGLGFGAVLTPPISSWLISIYDWRSAYAIVGTGTMVLIIVASLFLKRDPYQIGLLPHGIKQQSSAGPTQGFNFIQVVRTRQFWMVCGIYFCYGYCLHSVMVHIVPHATGMGISPTAAAGILATTGGASIIFRLMAGVASDRFGIKLTLVVALTMLLVALIWLQVASDLWRLSLFGVIFGFANGGTITMQTLLLAELFGLGSLGVVLGVATFIYTIGGATGPLLTGYIFDITGSYRLAFTICAVIVAVAVILALLITPIENKKEARVWNINE